MTIPTTLLLNKNKPVHIMTLSLSLHIIDKIYVVLAKCSKKKKYDIVYSNCKFN